MKELGRVEIYFSTDKENWVDTNPFFKTRIRYTEPFDDYIEEYDYEDVEKAHCGFWLHTPWLLNRKEYKEVGFEKQFRVYPNQKLYKKYEWNKLNYNASFDYLSRDMNTNEFVEYLKDNGLNVCPLK